MKRLLPMRSCGDLRCVGSDERGGAALEMALVLPVFFIFLFGLMSFAIVLFGYGNATFASRAGARFASLHSSTSLSPCTAASVQSFVTPFLWAAPTSGTTITTVWNPTNTVGSTVKVSVSIVYPIGVSVLSGGNVTVASSAQRVVAR
jgi:Flp pilus assembly protein TadG